LGGLARAANQEIYETRHNYKFERTESYPMWAFRESVKYTLAYADIGNTTHGNVSKWDAV
jgi:hypothetical protein